MAINYATLRTDVIALVKSFGKTAPMSILRVVEASAPDASMPWRRGDPTAIKEFRFIGVAFTPGFPALSEPVTEDDKTIIIPGDIVTTAAQGDPSTICGDLLLTDRVQIGSKQYQILGMQDITPDALPIIYKVKARAWQRLLMQPSSV